jgi:uncharacterized membrane protein YgdD (TMEM256/DUF423 family)
MKYPILGICGAMCITSAIGLGAYGAHGLEDAFAQTPRMKGAWGNAVDYQMFHGLALFVLGVVRVDQKRVQLWVSSGILMCLGVILFSCSIYAWVFGGSEAFTLVTPFGGFAFIFAWSLLVIHQFLSLKSRNEKHDSCINE